MLNNIKKILLDRTKLLKVDEIFLTEQAIAEFEEIYKGYLSAEGEKHIAYQSQYPMYMFLYYLIEHKDVLVHGSNNPNIAYFEPRDSTLFMGQPIKAVFASSDGVWALFFAVKNREGYVGSIRNFCITVPTKKGKKRYYYFSRNGNEVANVWREGAIYLFSREMFKQGGIRDEWVCEQRVKPIAILSVTPNDFPFLDKVSIHKETDSMVKTIMKAIFIKK